MRQMSAFLSCLPRQPVDQFFDRWGHSPRGHDPYPFEAGQRQQRSVVEVINDQRVQE
jgi:hypothetical protein